MTVYPVCRCGHFQQIHVAGTSPCRGACSRRDHAPDDHTGQCTAKCICERYRAAA